MKGTAPKVNREADLRFALPTEAQWEYACRAGTQTRFYYGDDLNEEELEGYAWYRPNSDGQTHAVGQKKPNAWGLYDMHGNVFEWCQDMYGPYPAGEVVDPTGLAGGVSPTFRGGSWHGAANTCRSAWRRSYALSTRDCIVGCRVALRMP